VLSCQLLAKTRASFIFIIYVVILIFLAHKSYLVDENTSMY